MFFFSQILNVECLFCPQRHSQGAKTQLNTAELNVVIKRYCSVFRLNVNAAYEQHCSVPPTLTSKTSDARSFAYVGTERSSESILEAVKTNYWTEKTADEATGET